MPYIKAKDWEENQNEMHRLKKRVEELESEKIDDNQNSDSENNRETTHAKPKDRGGSCYGLNGWEISIENGYGLEEKDMDIIPEKGYNHKIVDWKVDDNFMITFNILSLSPTAKFSFPEQAWSPRYLRGNDLTGPSDPDLTSP